MATANFSIIPKDVFERGIIRMTEGGIVTMPDKDVWMTVDEIADMLFVSSATVFRKIRSIYNIRYRRRGGHSRLIPFVPLSPEQEHRRVQFGDYYPSDIHHRQRQ